MGTLHKHQVSVSYSKLEYQQLQELCLYTWKKGLISFFQLNAIVQLAVTQTCTLSSSSDW